MTPIKLLFVKFKAILCGNVCDAETIKIFFIAIPMHGNWKIVVQPNLQRDYWKHGDKTGTPLSIYGRMAVPNTHPFITQTQSWVVVLLLLQ